MPFHVSYQCTHPFVVLLLHYLIDCIDGGPVVPGATCAIVINTIYLRSFSELVPETVVESIKTKMKDPETAQKLEVLLIV
jgi:hypothetical protein